MIRGTRVGGKEQKSNRCSGQVQVETPNAVAFERGAKEAWDLLGARDLGA